MLRLVIMIIGCSTLAYLSERREGLSTGTNGVRNERVLSFVLICWMVFFAGLRTSYNDTYTYINGFRMSGLYPDVLKDIDWELGANPGFKIFTAIFRTSTSNYHTYLLACSAFTLGVTMCFIHRYTTSYPVSVFLFFTQGYFLFTMAALKQTIAISIGILAIEAFLKKRRLLFVLLILFASLFHTYVLMFLLVPILYRMTPWKKSTYFLIVGTIIIAFSYSFLIGTFRNVTDFFGEGYAEDMFIGEGVNIFRVLVYFAPVILSFIVRKEIQEKNSREFNLFINFSIVCAMIMFVGLFGNANSYARLAMYFEVPIYIVLPWLIDCTKQYFRLQLLTPLSCILYSLYFYYMVGINKPFDVLFRYITLPEYLNTLF